MTSVLALRNEIVVQPFMQDLQVIRKLVKVLHKVFGNIL